MQFIGSSILLALSATVSGALIPRTTGPGTIAQLLTKPQAYSLYKRRSTCPGGGLGACGNPIQNSDFAVALSSTNYAGGAHCGQNVNVNFNGASITVTVADLCTGCEADGIDLTQGAFQALADPSVGVIEVNWDFA
ncbi:Barwin-like endoglucanase [Mycena venus]|uniref:Barwin-like endoglucanase n=1 Tax=Mycena venus TaxID=2733690 RepID=A0A8H7D8D4_9AGAR|nr:Barwin-like endoglucanase [Mycena venus]